jgi:hypothetical protein
MNEFLIGCSFNPNPHSYGILKNGNKFCMNETDFVK